MAAPLAGRMIHGPGKLDYFSPRHQFLYLVVLLRRKLIGRNGRKFCKSRVFIRVPRFRVKISLFYRNIRRYFHGLL